MKSSISLVRYACIMYLNCEVLTLLSRYHQLHALRFPTDSAEKIVTKSFGDFDKRNISF